MMNKLMKNEFKEVMSKEEVMNEMPNELKYRKTELNDDMLNTVAGGGIPVWTWLNRGADAFVDWAREFF